MTEEIEKQAAARMGKTVVATRADLARIRTGRASPALLDHLTVKYYDNVTPLNQVATIAVMDARTLSVQPWEKHMLPVVEKAILESDLGLNPVTAGETIRLPLPLTTEDRRRELVKLVKREGENGKIAIRNIRRDAVNTVRDLEKEKKITQDGLKQSEAELQTVTNRYIAEIDRVVAEKERELMEI